MNTIRLLERFLRYVNIDTRSVFDSPRYPSSEGQRELGRLLVAELTAIGLTDASQDEWGIVMGTLPATPGNESVPMISWCAHMDTSPEASGQNVKPAVIRNYDGQKINLYGNTAITLTLAKHPELAEMCGKTLIVTDGTTLLGADDKAGLAIIMEAIESLCENASSMHGPIRVCFSCDEETGCGADHLNPQKLGTACYTVDGDAGEKINIETFSAAQAIVRVTGQNCHPGAAKGFMINAVRVLSRFIELLPRAIAPETTDERDGFLHPFEMSGDTASAAAKVLIRDFETHMLSIRGDFLRSIGKTCELEFPGAKVEIEITEQYLNMRDDLNRDPRSFQLAEQALRNLGKEPIRKLIRGGTDGSRLTAMGVPTPNLSAGAHCMHSVEEWACLEEMETTVQWLCEIAKLWTNE